MDIKFVDEKIVLEKELNSLDQLVIDFVTILRKCKISYVLVSGYVSILFGRNRASEDIDLIVGDMDAQSFAQLWKRLNETFDCVNTENQEEAYQDYLLKKVALRFAKKGAFIPNVEMKFPKNELDRWTLKERKIVLLNQQELFISPLEVQIPFKLFLGSEKDIEDARYLYRLFKDNLNMGLLTDFNRKLKIERVFNKYLQ